MKHLILILLYTAPILFYSCKKEKVTIDQKSKTENLLVMRLDHDFEPVDYKEFIIKNLKHVNDSLPINISREKLFNDKYDVYYTIEPNQDTIVEILSSSFVYPEFISENNTTNDLSYPWFYVADNIYNLKAGNINLNELWNAVKYTEIIKLYCLFYPNAKITITREIIHNYDPDLELSIPKTYYLLFIG